MSEREIDPALERAIEVAGGAAALARKLGITVQAVCDWRKCPPARAAAIEAATDGAVTREQLCPHIFAARVA
jgi:DNA-binding transcriptional regulator YdaS (Cro superfamily)